MKTGSSSESNTTLTQLGPYSRFKWTNYSFLLFFLIGYVITAMETGVVYQAVPASRSTRGRHGDGQGCHSLYCFQLCFNSTQLRVGAAIFTHLAIFRHDTCENNVHIKNDHRLLTCAREFAKKYLMIFRGSKKEKGEKQQFCFL